MPKFGEQVLLNCQLWDGAENKHVYAWVYATDGTELVNSPYYLPHLAHGLYLNHSDVVMPQTQELVAVYRVFSDIGRNVPSPDHSDCIDVFKLDDLSGGASGGGGVELVGQIFEGEVLVGEIDDCDALNGSSPC